MERIHQIIPLGEDLFQVNSFNYADKTYVVDLREHSCTCPNFKFRGVKCKHLKLVEETRSKEKLVWIAGEWHPVKLSTVEEDILP